MTTQPKIALWFKPSTQAADWVNVEIHDESGREYRMYGVTATEAAYVMDALDAFGVRFGHMSAKSCFCEARGIGKPGVTCGDCWRDYKEASHGKV